MHCDLPCALLACTIYSTPEAGTEAAESIRSGLHAFLNGGAGAHAGAGLPMFPVTPAHVVVPTVRMLIIVVVDCEST